MVVPPLPLPGLGRTNDSDPFFHPATPKLTGAASGWRIGSVPEISKTELRKALRAKRRAHVDEQPEAIRALLFHRPPVPLLSKIAPNAVIGLYHAGPWEAPTASYARHFFEAGHTLALPHFASRDAPMTFRQHIDPHSHGDLEIGPFGMLQPNTSAREITPDVLFLPLIGFTARGERLGQGGGHYDRWLAEHPGRIAIGMAWDVQLCDELPAEQHDMALDAVVTPTRIYGPF